MSKEQQELADRAYENYNKEILRQRELQKKEVERLRSQGKRVRISLIELLSKEEFINKCKTDSEFSQRWGLKIEERELDMFERWKIADLTPNMMEFDYCNKLCDEHNIPTKLITITYNDKTIDSKQ
jgi:hypothetical protein